MPFAMLDPTDRTITVRDFDSLLFYVTQKNPFAAFVGDGPAKIVFESEESLNRKQYRQILEALGLEIRQKHTEKRSSWMAFIQDLNRLEDPRNDIRA